MFNFNDYIIEQAHVGLSVKEYLRTVQGFSGRELQKLTRAKGISINDRRCILDKKLKYKDSLKILILQERLNIIPETGLEIDVLYEDAGMLVANKPAGMLVHPTGQTKSGTLINYLSAKYQHDRAISLHALHRLDRDTSGCVLFAKNAKIRSELEKAMQTGKIQRIYQAVVLGKPTQECGVIIAKIGQDPFAPNRRLVSAGGQEAITEYKLLEELGDNVHLLELNLRTGRTHQIRLHLSHIGLPILGDGMYGIRKFNAKRQLLHAVKMHFNNFGKYDNLEIIAPIPEDIHAFITGKKQISNSENDLLGQPIERL